MHLTLVPTKGEAMNKQEGAPCGFSAVFYPQVCQLLQSQDRSTWKGRFHRGSDILPITKDESVFGK